MMLKHMAEGAEITRRGFCERDVESEREVGRRGASQILRSKAEQRATPKALRRILDVQLNGLRTTARP